MTRTRLSDRHTVVSSSVTSVTPHGHETLESLLDRCFSLVTGLRCQKILQQDPEQVTVRNQSLSFFFTHNTSTIFFSNLLRSILFQLFQNCTVSLGPYKFLPTSNLVKDLESTGVLGSGGKIENHFVKLPDYEISCVWILLCRGVRPYPSDPGHKQICPEVSRATVVGSLSKPVEVRGRRGELVLSVLVTRNDDPYSLPTKDPTESRTLRN